MLKLYIYECVFLVLPGQSKKLCQRYFVSVSSSKIWSLVDT